MIQNLGAPPEPPCFPHLCTMLTPDGASYEAGGDGSTMGCPPYVLLDTRTQRVPSSIHPTAGCISYINHISPGGVSWSPTFLRPEGGLQLGRAWRGLGAPTFDGQGAGGALGRHAGVTGHHPQVVLGDPLPVQHGGGGDEPAGAVDEEIHAGHPHLHAVCHLPIGTLVQVDGHYLEWRAEGRVSVGEPGCLLTDENHST